MFPSLVALIVPHACILRRALLLCGRQNWGWTDLYAHLLSHAALKMSGLQILCLYHHPSIKPLSPIPAKKSVRNQWENRKLAWPTYHWRVYQNVVLGNIPSHFLICQWLLYFYGHTDVSVSYVHLFLISNWIKNSSWAVATYYIYTYFIIIYLLYHIYLSHHIIYSV